MQGFNSFFQYNFILQIWIVGINLHPDSFSNFCHIPGNPAKTIKGKCFACQFRSGFTVKFVSGNINHHSDGKFSNGIGILPWCVHSYNIMCSCGFQVNIVIASTGTDYNFKFGSGIKSFRIHNIAANNYCFRSS